METGDREGSYTRKKIQKKTTSAKLENTNYKKRMHSITWTQQDTTSEYQIIIVHKSTFHLLRFVIDLLCNMLCNKLCNIFRAATCQHVVQIVIELSNESTPNGNNTVWDIWKILKGSFMLFIAAYIQFFSIIYSGVVS